MKPEENCPAQDQGANGPAEAGSTIPDFKGKAVSVVRDSLPGNTSLGTKDAGPRNRAVLVQSNWQVCGRDPAPGAALTGQPVSVTAVKFGETCPWRPGPPECDRSFSVRYRNPPMRIYQRPDHRH